MKAMVFAAGKGERMMPLTAEIPKPLLEAGGMSLLERNLRKLDKSSCREVVINVSYQASRVVDAVSTLSFDNIECVFSRENELLDTGGALLHARRLLGENPFLLTNADVWSELDFSELLERTNPLQSLVHLVFVPNPKHKPQGDFKLAKNGKLSLLSDETISAESVTFSGISIVDPHLIDRFAPNTQVFPFRHLIIAAIYQGLASGELYEGPWMDVGTPERLRELDERL